MNVLMYHFVNSSNDSSLFKGMHGVSIDEFERQVKFLTKNYRSLTENDIKNAAYNDVYPDEFSFYMTFDDGLKQHFKNVYPILKDFWNPS